MRNSIMESKNPARQIVPVSLMIEEAGDLTGGIFTVGHGNADLLNTIKIFWLRISGAEKCGLGGHFWVQSVLSKLDCE